MAELTPEQKFALISRNLQEVCGKEKLQAILKERDLKLYWGTAPTGRPHVGYLVPLMKIADFLRAGCHVTILFANLHAYLDNMKAPWDLLEIRTRFYEAVIKAALETVGVNLEKLHFSRGTEYELSKEFTLDVYKLTSLVTEHDAKKAGAEVVKQSDNPLVSGLLYPLLQTLDEEYLKVDAQFGGVDQRKIFMFAEKYLPALGYEKRAHLMNPMVPGLVGSKMSSSDPDSKIDLLDEPEAVTRKIRKAFCEEGNIENNPLLTFCKMVILPILNGEPFVINRAEKFGGVVSYAKYEDLEKAFAEKSLFPGDLKLGVTDVLNKVIATIRAKFDNPEMVELLRKAYPDMPLPRFSCVQPEKKQKQKKAPAPAKPAVEDVSRMRMQVGLIKTIEKHPNADSLFVETVNFGEEDRTIVSGLAKYYQPEELQGKKAVFLTNLKKGKLRGVLSEGMIMAASNDAHDQVEVIFCEDAEPGERVVVEGFLGEADKQVDAKKANGLWEKSVQPFYSTNDKLEVTWKDVVLKSEKTGSICKVKSLVGGSVH